jgi:ribonuclease HI
MRAAINWTVDVCFNLISEKENDRADSRQARIQCWQCPTRNTLKVNVDGAFIEVQGSGAVGAVVRDAEGSFLLVTSRRLQAVQSALTAEAEALRDGVRLIHSVTTGPVVMENDSLELVSLWRKRSFQRSELVSIFRDIDDLAESFSSLFVEHARRSANKAAHACAKFAALAESFSSLFVEHARRSANKAAHACAKFAAPSDFEVWANEPPSFLVPVLLDDCNHMYE